MNQNLSIITNFGCIYNCSFCISSSQNSKNDYKFKLQDARDIKKFLQSGIYTRLSISGGGDPLYIHNADIELLYKFIIKNCIKYNIHLSFHTNFKKPSVKLARLSSGNYYKQNYVISIHAEDYLHKFHYWSEDGWNNGFNLRFAYVIGYNSNDLELITDMLEKMQQDAKLTLKQLDGTVLENIKDINKIKKLIADRKNCIILESGDYNTYYNLRDNTTYDKFKEINFEQ